MHIHFRIFSTYKHILYIQNYTLSKHDFVSALYKSGLVDIQRILYLRVIHHGLTQLRYIVFFYSHHRFEFYSFQNDLILNYYDM